PLALAGVDDQQPLLRACGPRGQAARDRLWGRAELGPRRRLLGVVGIAAVVRRVDARVGRRRPASVGAEPMENMRLHRPIVQEMLGDDALQQCVIYMVIPRPVGVDDQDRTPSAHSETAAQRTLDALRVPERGQPVDARQGPEVSCQALRGLWRGAVAVFADQDLTPVGPHTRGTGLL